MQSLSNDEQRGVLGEVLADQLQLILEYVQVIPSMQRQLHKMQEEANEGRGRVNVLEAVVKAHEMDLRQLKRGLV